MTIDDAIAEHPARLAEAPQTDDELQRRLAAIHRRRTRPRYWREAGIILALAAALAALLWYAGGWNQG